MTTPPFGFSNSEGDDSADQNVDERYHRQSANAGILITSGTFTLEASRFAGYGHIQLIDGPRVLALLRESEATQKPVAQAPRAGAAAR